MTNRTVSSTSTRVHWLHRLQLASVAVLLIVMGGTELMAQSYKLSGRVYDGDESEWMMSAAIRLLQPKDSTLIKGAMTDANGRFAISNIKSSRVLVEVSFVGYTPYYKLVTFDADHKSVSLGTVTLKPDAKLLTEVDVVAQSNPMTLKKDTVQFNADAFRVREGANVEELLRRIPGIVIDDDGGITYNGEAINRLEVDGKEFFSNTPTMATKNLPSSIIQNIQVVDKKSEQARMTGMDDGEKEKVLNLQIKADKKKGVMMNINAGYGTRERYRADLMSLLFLGDTRYTLIGNINNTDGVQRGRGDRTSKELGLNIDHKFSNQLSATADIGYDGRRTVTHTMSSTQNILSNSERNHEVSNSTSDTGRDDLNFRSRIEWRPSKGTFVVVEPEASYEWRRSRSESSYTTRDTEEALVNEGSGLQESKITEMDAGLRAFARHTFNEAGRNIFGRLFVDYSSADGTGISQSTTKFAKTGVSEVIDQQTKTGEQTFAVRGGLSYLEPLTDKWSAQLNYGLNYQKRSSENMAYNKGADGQYSIVNTDYSQNSYNTNVNHTLGALMRYTFMTRSYVLLGFDANPTTMSTITTDGVRETFNMTRTVWNYAPSFTLDMNPTDSIHVNMRYMGRTGYPSMAQLNPALVVTSPLERTKGNPDLLPSFRHNMGVHLKLSSRAKRTSFEIFGNGGFTNNAVAAKTNTDVTTGERTRTYENVNGLWQMWYGLTYTTPLGGAKSKWTSFSFLNFMFNRDKGFVNEVMNTSNYFSPRLNQRFTWSGNNLQVTTGLDGNIARVKNTVATNLNRTTVDYGVYNELVWNLPWNLTLTNKLSYRNAVGYDDEIKRELLLWDMTLGWSFLKGKAATLELSGYDILGQRTNLGHQVSAQSIVDTQVSGITSYVMLTFSYRFNRMGGTQVHSDDDGHDHAGHSHSYDAPGPFRGRRR